MPRTPSAAAHSTKGSGRRELVGVPAFHHRTSLCRRVVVCGGGLSGADAALGITQVGHAINAAHVAALAA